MSDFSDASRIMSAVSTEHLLAELELRRRQSPSDFARARGDVRSGDLVDVSVLSGVSLFDGAGFCQVTAHLADGPSFTGQLSPAEVRAMALQWLEAADASESDAAVVAELRALDTPDELVMGFLNALRRRRSPDPTN